MAATIRSLPPGARPAEVWRSAAFALLRLNPKEGEALALVFEDESVSDDTRGLVLDLLAGAGTFESQVLIRRLLALSVARRSNRTFAGFVQRLGFLEQPDGPTLRFLMSVYAESRNEPQDVRSACAYALGAAAGQAFAAGDPEAAVRASDVIRRDLVTTEVLIDKCALLTALGNAGVPSDVMVVTRFTQDSEAPVRAAAALALRKMSAVPEACSNLVSLLADPQIKVAQSALLALADHKLDDDEMERVAELVLAGRTSPAIDMRVLTLLVAQRPRMTSCPGRAGAIENALRLLLGRVEAAVAASEPAGSGERRVAFQGRSSSSSHASSVPPPNGPNGPNQSGSVPAMPIARAYSSVTRPSEMPVPLEANPSLPATVLAAPAPARIHAQAPIQVGPAVPAAMAVALPPAVPLPPIQSQPIIQIPPPPPRGGANKSAPKRAAATQIGLPMHLPPEVAAMVAESAQSAAATIVDQAPLGSVSGAGNYRLVSPGDSVETVRARMLEMGLDPNARMSIIPQPPPRREVPATRMQPNAVVRNGGRTR